MRRLAIMIPTSFVLAAMIMFGAFVNQPSAPHDLAAAEPAVKDAVSAVLKSREAEILQEGDASFGDKDTINILALGIDSRKDGAYAHCDAIHMVSLNVKTWTVTIISVPRGTTSPLPPIPGHTYLTTDYYLANACYFGGLDYGVKQIEKVAGVKADYVATVGFSEALGIFRALNLPTTDTLEFLRHRRSYQIGDPQRSANQGTFMKDVLLKLTRGDKVPTPFLYLMYKFVHTDMDFATVKALYDAYYAAGIGNHPESVTQIMKPEYAVKEMHFDPSNADQQVGALIDFLKGKVSSDDLSLRSIDDVQSELVAYLRAGLSDDEVVERVYDAQMWQQVENDDDREELEFRYLDRYVALLEPKDPQAAEQAISDYILVKDYYGLTEWKDKGARLLESFLKAHPTLSPA
jgi:anionic cell wall polymer biosynthesis LytR-Cps2A-Psr (LCP) family protein